MLVTFVFAYGQKMNLQKRETFQKVKKHPYTSLLSQVESKAVSTKTDKENYNRLLVILVDFQEEESQYTTGNGKFLLEPDPNWKTSIGAPPHNREFYEANMEALRYYYKAVSMELYDLEYEVYPKDKPAYTLSNPMSYYNPPGVSSDIFVQKMEEYFKESFELADRDDPDIDFGSFGHYMIIHAGSDWQHDVNGDSPSDLPSFFIRVGAGKEAIVNNGNVSIYQACNVPSMISQDFRTINEDGQDYHVGYGAVNSVFAHEFGHSLGLVDLYNVYTFQPMVGSFDIMDSGGGGILVDVADDDSYVLVEGALPVLPGAFSRELLFGDLFRDRGYLKDANQVSFGVNVPIRASSSRQNQLNPQLSLLKIPLNQTEYVLLENRSVDPDGDGATSVYGALGKRVVLYPTALQDVDNKPTYEYDYLLPSFIRPNGDSVGGGILAWHIDEKVLYHQGSVASDGTFYSNFFNNSVNTNYYNRGVKIIEADALPDIGNIYSYYWAGTPYEYYHKNKPILDSDGFFVNWSLQTWNDKLDSTSKPQLVDNNGNPSLYGVTFPGNPAELMSIRLSTGFFDSYQSVSTGNSESSLAPVINSSFSTSDELPVLTSDSITLLTHNQVGNQYIWQDLFGSFSHSFGSAQYPIIKSDYNSNGIHELVLARDINLAMFEFADDSLLTRYYSFSDSIVSTPLYSSGAVWVPTRDALIRLQAGDSTSIEVQNLVGLAGLENNIIALQADSFSVIDTQSLTVDQTVYIGEACGLYEPVIYQNGIDGDYHILVMTNLGNLYHYTPHKLVRIHRNPTPNSLPTQIGVTKLGDYSPVVFFGLGNRIYALLIDGSNYSGFPKSYDKQSFDPYGHPKSLRMGDVTLLSLPSNENGYFSVDQFGNIKPYYSLTWDRVEGSDYLYWQQSTEMLYWMVSEKNGSIGIHSLGGQTENPILWNGFRNGDRGVFCSPLSQEVLPGIPSFDAFVYPNPSRHGHLRIRLIAPGLKTEIKFFDISGTKVYEATDYSINENIKDIQVDTSKLSSGVYYAILKSDSGTKKIKFSIEK